ncbi:MAG: hypothetical protein IIX01_00720 [Clostridia bacterium]|nr:hypothetical protein [Clostridia bacterium]
MFIKKKNFIGCIIAISFVFLFSFVFSNPIQASAESGVKEEKKVYCQATIEDEFSDDSILIVLTNKESLNK